MAKVKKIAVIVFFAAVVILGGYLLTDQFTNKIKASEFIGTVVGIDGNILKLSGYFETPSGDGQLKQVEVIVDSKTEFLKTIVHMPTVADLEKTGGFYTFNDLQKEEVMGSLDDLKNSKIMVSAISEKNIYNKSKFKAKKLSYLERVYED